MRLNFDEYKKDFNDIRKRHGVRIFKKQLEGLEGENIIVDGIELRCLIINEENINSDKKEFRTVCVELETPIEHGSYVVYRNETYLVITDIDYHYYYKSCKIRKCNQKFKWEDKNNVFEYYCIAENESYGVKLISTSGVYPEIDQKCKVTIQRNENTLKIMPDLRFVFSNSITDIYKVNNRDSAISKGLIELTCKKDNKKDEDEIEENLAFNYIINDEKEKEKSYKIIGEDKLIKGKNQTYSLNPSLDNCVWELDNTSKRLKLATIIAQNSRGCVVKGQAYMEEPVVLICKRNEEIIAKIQLECVGGVIL